MKSNLHNMLADSRHSLRLERRSNYFVIYFINHLILFDIISSPSLIVRAYKQRNLGDWVCRQALTLSPSSGWGGQFVVSGANALCVEWEVSDVGWLNFGGWRRRCCCCGESKEMEKKADFVFEQFIDDFVMKKTLKYHLMNYVSDERESETMTTRKKFNPSCWSASAAQIPLRFPWHQPNAIHSRQKKKKGEIQQWE